MHSLSALRFLEETTYGSLIFDAGLYMPVARGQGQV